MAASRRVYDSRHLQADCKIRDQLRNRKLGYRVWATFTFYYGRRVIRVTASSLLKCHNSYAFVMVLNTNFVAQSGRTDFFHICRTWRGRCVWVSCAEMAAFTNRDAVWGIDSTTCGPKEPCYPRESEIRAHLRP